MLSARAARLPVARVDGETGSGARRRDRVVARAGLRAGLARRALAAGPFRTRLLLKAPALSRAHSANLRAGRPVISQTVEVTTSGESTNLAEVSRAVVGDAGEPVLDILGGELLPRSPRPIASPIVRTCLAWGSSQAR
jgi:hypothetical protein